MAGRYSLKIILWCCLFLITQQVYGQKYEARTYPMADGHTLPYRVLLPENYQTNKRYPVILFLHGAGERGSDNEKQLTHGSKIFLEDSFRKDYPAIVLFPQCPEDSYWASMNIDRGTYPIKTDFHYAKKPNWPLQAARDLVDTWIREGHGDADQIYIMGLSMGGMGTFESLIRWPKMFAAAAAICGGGDVRKAKRFAHKVPVWVFHGDADGVVPVVYSREMVQQLKDLHADVRYTEYPGVNHNSWDNAFMEKELLPWLMMHQKK